LRRRWPKFRSSSLQPNRSITNRLFAFVVIGRFYFSWLI
jgi:hypothetical protein